MKRYKWLLVICLLVLLPLTGSCEIAETIRKSDTQGYMLIFAEKGTEDIKIRWSNEGTIWQTASYGNASTSKGVGAASETVGLVRIMSWINSSNHFEFVWGLGATFDDPRTAIATSQIATSAPSAVHGEDLKWIIAYRTSGDVIAVRVYDTSQHDFLDMNMAPIENAYNDTVWGRPALVRLGDRVVMAWNRNGSLRFAVGTVQDSSIVNWTDKVGLSLPSEVENSCYGGVYSEPTLTHDHSKFYLGFTRRTVRCSSGGEFLSREDLFLYSSTDGIHWALEDINYQIPLDCFVNIAGRSDGSIIAAIVGYANTEVDKWTGGSWTELSTSDVFNYTPDYQQFSLIATGRPPVED